MYIYICICIYVYVYAYRNVPGTLWADTHHQLSHHQNLLENGEPKHSVNNITQVGPTWWIRPLPGLLWATHRAPGVGVEALHLDPQISGEGGSCPLRKKRFLWTSGGNPGFPEFQTHILKWELGAGVGSQGSRKAPTWVP